MRGAEVPPVPETPAPPGRPKEVLAAFLQLGLTSFGGPVAHLGFFRTEFVARRHWLDEAAYGDIVALCQFLPGPASSQVAVTLGIRRAGLAGGLAAWFGFTAPSALAMLLFACGVGRAGHVEHAAWLRGLKLVAVAVVAQAVWSMARALCPDRARQTLGVAAAALALALPGVAGQLGAILLGAAVGLCLPRGAPPPPTPTPAAPVKAPRGATLALVAFAALLLGLPALAGAGVGGHALALVDRFYRVGALVFGGGHVVLPLLQQAVVPPGWIGNDGFLAGYGAAQAVPGPLFSFAAYLGAAMAPAPNGWAGGLLCLVAIYLPSFLLLLGVLPFWEALRRRPAVQAALRGVNATVVGLLLAALYTPVWTSAVGSPAGFAMVCGAFLALAVWRVPPWLIVLGGAAAASALGWAGVPV
jgi:chromate transporter